MKTIGLIINPISGMGGKVGLKGTDGAITLNKAVKLGAVREAPCKALKALEKLIPLKDDLLILTSSNDMGEIQCKSLGFNYKIVYKTGNFTNYRDTINAARIFEKLGVELILFAGGDGTARDIYKAVEIRIPALGIPTGVKIHSPVYANTPELAGDLALMYLKNGNLCLKDEEVIDIDEKEFRNNRVVTRLFGYLKVPYKKRLLQNKKSPTPLGDEESQKAIALDIIDNMLEGVYYVIGPGTTTRAIMEELNLPNSLLGVDIIRDRKIVKLDCNESDILDIDLERVCKLVIAPTGGQGYLLGRGNQQISSRVISRIKKENIIIISSNSKIIELRGNPLFVYTGDPAVDKYLEGYYRIKVGYGNDLIYKVSGGEDGKTLL
ncbi:MULTISPECIES: ATP-NAD kinase family protein [Tissierellales]|jgi:predicted polyphosphate/ATP-dependent NAD kinase|uniref:ATP-NAD kinase n=1 Tax=Acidilutibacter cellobiosedens TaxID=2507161 RepID=A0A410QAM1_9FIRM|nr:MULTISPECIES: ATP-NAD kinase family protein [Tissierellales]QAT61009.1 ATP-NAD kinase [Acidilutibacter cellobiosedens]SCL89347.1 hypothetical protein PP176A_1729 [Sporanaerobacter sp. PP17-6a]